MSTAALDHITVRGFRSIASIDGLDLSPVNLLIGANGSGKSNFLGVFAFLHEVREERLQDYVRRAGGADQLLHFGARVSPEIHIVLSFQGGINEYELTLRPTNDDSLYPAREVVRYWNKKGYPSPKGLVLSPREQGREAGISGPPTSAIAHYVRDRLDRWRSYHMHDTSALSPMRKTAQVHDNKLLRPDGSNLASFLYFLQRRHRESYELIRRAVQSVAPFFDDFDLRPDPVNPDTIRLAWRHKGSDQYFGAAALSDGSLRFIALATLFLQPLQFRPSTILVDEPELGLHPFAITLLASLVKQASAQTQVILSTQSPFLLDHFEPEDVLVAERVGGSTRLTRLQSSALAAWLEDYSLGQLWEKNEFGGRPAPE